MGTPSYTLNRRPEEGARPLARAQGSCWYSRRCTSRRVRPTPERPLSNAERRVSEEVIDAQELGQGPAVGIVRLRRQDGVAQPPLPS